MDDTFFGELYLRTTRPLFAQRVTDEEVAWIDRALDRLGASGPIVDLGAGHGRHAAPLRALGHRVLALERDGRSLLERLRGFPAVRADFYRLPFPDGALGGAYAWYSTLFTRSDAEHRDLLREVARALRPGGALLFQTVPFERLEARPRASFRHTLPDGSLLEEESHFDPATGRDQGTRTLRLPDGRSLTGQYSIRYYRRPELEHLLKLGGFRPTWIEGGPSGGEAALRGTDLRVGATRDG